MLEDHQQLVKTARVAGVWYMLLAVSGVLGFIVFHSKVYVTNDPGKTLANLSADASVANVRLIFEILIIFTQALAALWFYRLFKGISAWHAWAIGIWGTVNSVLIGMSAIAMASAIQLAGSSLSAADDKLLFVELLSYVMKHAWGIGGIFFGLWLLPMGHVIIVSKRMPVWLGRVLVIGGIGYVLQTIISYAGMRHALLSTLTIPATVGEFWMIGYLLVFGIRPVRSN